MYDVDGNGTIDPEEMTKVVQSIYDMLGQGAVKPKDTAERRTKFIFGRFALFLRKEKIIQKAEAELVKAHLKPRFAFIIVSLQRFKHSSSSEAIQVT